MSPFTEPITTLPMAAAFSVDSCFIYGFAIFDIFFNISPAIINSGRKYFPSSNRFPRVLAALEHFCCQIYSFLLAHLGHGIN
jgi:hypothetical protein